MKETTMKLTYDEWMMALCIWREARGEILSGKIAVGEVIRNRMRARGRWRSTIVGVITQPKQFSAFNAGDPNATKFPKPTEQAWLGSCASAGLVMQDASVDIADGANHYHTKAVSPYWARDKTPVIEIGNHVFYRL